MRYNYLPVFLLSFLLQNQSVAQNFRVQIGAFEAPVPASYFTERGQETYVETVDQLGMHRYFAGSYATRIEAEAVLTEMVAKGFPFAAIVDVEEQRILRGVGCPYFRNGILFLQEPQQETTVRNLYFEFGLSKLSPESIAELNSVAAKLQQNGFLRLKILGYTDGVGDPQANVELAASRARESRNYLINKGIRADRMFISVFGEADPVLPNGEEVGNGKIVDLPENRKWNRRVVLVLVDEKVK
ncbi:MAG: OmpA family protein [Saprospiraceae bacterium]|nr:OmpA family protein [Saprospiraceae bacterium]